MKGTPWERRPIGDRFVDRLVSCVVGSILNRTDRRRLQSARRRRRTSSTSRMRVSVPVATYDRIPLVMDRTIPALLSQSHTDVEVVVVGDGTPSELWRKLEGIGDPRVRARRLRRRTRYPRTPMERWMVAGWRPRQVGARMATGEWLLWISDDDVLLPDGIERLLDVVRADPTTEVVTGAYFVGTAREVVRRPDDGGSGLGFTASGMPALLVRADLRRIGWNRHSWRKRWNRPSDYDLMDRLHRAGARWGATDALVAVVPEVEGTGVVGSQGSILEDERRRSVRRT